LTIAQIYNPQSSIHPQSQIARSLMQEDNIGRLAASLHWQHGPIGRIAVATVQ